MIRLASQQAEEYRSVSEQSNTAPFARHVAQQTRSRERLGGRAASVLSRAPRSNRGRLRILSDVPSDQVPGRMLTSTPRHFRIQARARAEDPDA
jgi:hypothetical protein